MTMNLLRYSSSGCSNQPSILENLFWPSLAGRMIKWEIKLYEFDIGFESRTTLKAHVLFDSLAEMTLVAPTESPAFVWLLYVDGSSNSKGSGSMLILESGEGLIVEVSLTFSFLTSNNHAKYKACI